MSLYTRGKTMDDKKRVLVLDTPETRHVRLSSLVRSYDKGVPSTAVRAADSVADEGGSPRAQIQAAREATGKRLTYNAHVGSRQAQRNLERLAKKFLPCPLCGGVEGCNHSMQERRDNWVVTEDELLEALKR